MDWLDLGVRETSDPAFFNPGCCRGLSGTRLDPQAVFGRPFGFGFGWGQHAERGMPSACVVPELDVVVYRRGELNPGLPLAAVEQLDLHPSPEAFHHRVVVPETASHEMRERVEFDLLVADRAARSACHLVLFNDPELKVIASTPYIHGFVDGTTAGAADIGVTGAFTVGSESQVFDFCLPESTGQTVEHFVGTAVQVTDLVVTSN